MISAQARRGRTFVAESPHMQDKPLPFGDIDVVISPWGSGSNARPAGTSHNADGVIHVLSSEAGIHLPCLAQGFDLVWCSGREEKAEEHLPHALALPGEPAFLSFSRDPARRHAHPKLGAIEASAGVRHVDGLLAQAARLAGAA